MALVSGSKQPLCVCRRRKMQLRPVPCTRWLVTTPTCRAACRTASSACGRVGKASRSSTSLVHAQCIRNPGDTVQSHRRCRSPPSSNTTCDCWSATPSLWLSEICRLLCHCCGCRAACHVAHAQRATARTSRTPTGSRPARRSLRTWRLAFGPVPTATTGGASHKERRQMGSAACWRPPASCRRSSRRVA